MNDLKPLTYYLGISVTRHSSGIFLYGNKYVVEVLERVGMSSCKSFPTLVEMKSKLSTTTGTQNVDLSLYHILTNNLRYLTFTRPYISYMV